MRGGDIGRPVDLSELVAFITAHNDAGETILKLVSLSMSVMRSHDNPGYFVGLEAPLD